MAAYQPELSPGQRALTLEMAAALDRVIGSGELRVEEALAVLCSLAANLISMDPSTARQDMAVQAFSNGLPSELTRLRAVRMSDLRYRAAVR